MLIIIIDIHLFLICRCLFWLQIFFSISSGPTSDYISFLSPSKSVSDSTNYLFPPQSVADYINYINLIFYLLLIILVTNFLLKSLITNLSNIKVMILIIELLLKFVAEDTNLKFPILMFFSQLFILLKIICK